MFSCDLYLKVFEHHVYGRNIANGRSVELRPRSPYVHPRALVGTFSEADAVVTAVVKQIKGPTFFKTIRILIQPMAMCEGGCTQVESRVLRELALGAGAAKALVWTGSVLDDQSVRAKLEEL
ncbi:hypothetical protein KY495_13650 [Massilia sp. PAMC28688]|uniref:hypothetical protein n=1 Tax=Massilia sp. PAMC28688 TaxID=2861283 RepID=UPI001C63333F|nr:hypothetical protein [Massilia sp. PAMC28688]QYF91833.1 hypothetical protein KY495_13650 [Massilia sp. PAMC28688]